MSDEQHSSTVTKPKSRFARIVAWGRGDALVAKRGASGQVVDERATLLANRARASVDLAQHALNPQDPLSIGGEALASDLYRQAVYWALCALSHADGTLPPSGSGRLWDSLSPAQLAKAASTQRELASLRRALDADSFVYFAELDEQEQASVSAQLRRLSAALLLDVGEQRSLYEAIRRRRFFSISLILAVLVCVTWVPYSYWKSWQARRDMAVGRAWTASSDYGLGCKSPDQECLEKDGFFMHTVIDDPSPWLEVDLGRPKPLSRVIVENRSDCCIDRAVPLVIELSEDHVHYWKMAERKEEFRTWTASFPAQTARWVRVRIPHRGTLHLARVRIEQ